MDWVKVGDVTHYYDQIGVAVLLLEEGLEVGEWIAFVRGGDLLFEQEVVSMQIDYQAIDYADAGEAIGLQVSEKVKAGTEVYRRA